MGTAHDQPYASDPRYELAWSEALRGLTQQQGGLDSIRSRTSTLISASAISTSFLGGIAFNDGKVAGSGIAASILFGVTALLCVWILFPRPGWKWSNPTEQLLDKYIEGESPLSYDRMLRDLSIHMDSNVSDNRTKLNSLMRWYSLSSLLLAATIVCWLFELV